MAEADFNALSAAANGALDSTNVVKGVSIAHPTAEGSSACGLHSLTSVVGVAGWYVDLANFNPLQDNSGNQKGGSISCAMRKQTVASDYAPFIAFLSGFNVQSNKAYILGLTQQEPHQIILKKGALQSGLSTANDYLRLSDESFNAATQYIHLRLDCIVNPNGDVVLNVFRNKAAVATPTWETVQGMDPFYDDALGVNTSSVPLVSGLRAAFGAFFNGGPGRLALHDYLTVQRQLTP